MGTSRSCKAEERRPHSILNKEQCCHSACRSSEMSSERGGAPHKVLGSSTFSLEHHQLLILKVSQPCFPALPAFISCHVGYPEISTVTHFPSYHVLLCPGAFAHIPSVWEAFPVPLSSSGAAPSTTLDAPLTPYVSSLFS